MTWSSLLSMSFRWKEGTGGLLWGHIRNLFFLPFGIAGISSKRLRYLQPTKIRGWRGIRPNQSTIMFCEVAVCDMKRVSLNRKTGKKAKKDV